MQEKIATRSFVMRNRSPHDWHTQNTLFAEVIAQHYVAICVAPSMMLTCFIRSDVVASQINKSSQVVDFIKIEWCHSFMVLWWIFNPL